MAGCLVGTGLDEAANRPYMLIEGFDGKIHYLLQPPRLERMRVEGAVGIGDFLAVEAFERVDPSGQKRTLTRIDVYGSTLSTKLLDRELKQGGPVPGQTAPAGTVAGVFQAAAIARQHQRSKGPSL